MNEGCHGFYVQPPFSFYKKVIDENNFKKIIIVTEPDKKNPAIQMLLDTYTNSSIQSTNLYDDVSCIINAKNFLCNSQGTFGHMLALLSPNLKNIYIPYYLNPSKIHFDNTSFLKLDDAKAFFDMSNITHFTVHQYFIFNYILPFSWNPGDTNQVDLLKNLSVDNIHTV